jgi:hypothetical protein
MQRNCKQVVRKFNRKRFQKPQSNSPVTPSSLPSLQQPTLDLMVKHLLLFHTEYDVANTHPYEVVPGNIFPVFTANAKISSPVPR